ncbi:uncharacterized protein LOC132697938 [Cylas formicarius]|uniref:uncharacterized protein LOC132697938 n=1 Tax=Cylas formicarius TaxID=197179 RepID=UPI002958D1C9|nr:uncharacterized protein LOC132697938 [Cylas formicarius]
MKIYVLIFLAVLLVLVPEICGSYTNSRSEISHQDPRLDGVWKSKVQWKAHWVKHWEVKKVYVPVWKKVWTPVETREWLPIPKVPTKFG